ncbi:MAG TPA: DUF1552 domain-containing protein [Kofleriaceae bacterium]|nr:DUF1552 domain-containing protein [Kofleriaceae bacterium]
MITRRRLLQLGGAAALTLPLLRRRSSATTPTPRAKRLIVFYFPDGIVGASQSGEPSLWTPSGTESSFTLPDLLAPLAPYKSSCVFFRGLSMGPTDSGSHPGGAKKLLTATDGGNGISIDQHLAGSVGANDPFKLLYLGAQANANNASGDMRISYVSPGFTTPPDDDPVAVFSRVFGSTGTTGGGGGSADPRTARRISVLDNARAELEALEGKLGDVERAKLDLHLEGVREVESRLQMLSGTGATCDQPAIDATGLDASVLYAPERFPQILKAQTDLLVQAMACGMTRVGVIQSAHHTSDLIMSRFANTAMFDPNFDMRSHQASHYGAMHDPAHREYAAYAQQVTWWVQQYAYLLSQLAARPEDGGTMLDHSLVLLCSEIADGNTHLHDDMPFILAGGGGGTIRTGRFMDVGYRRHGELLVSIANAMGDSITSFGDSGSGPLPGLAA